MASRFATVSKDEILAVTEAAAPKNTKKETKFGLSLFTARKKKNFLAEFAKKSYEKMIPETLSKQTPQNKL